VICGQWRRQDLLRGGKAGDYVMGMGAARHGQDRGGTCPPPLEMRKWVFVTVTNCTLEYLNRQ